MPTAEERIRENIERFKKIAETVKKAKETDSRLPRPSNRTGKV